MIADEPFILAKSDDSWALQGYRTTSVTVLDDSEVEAAFELAQNPYQARWLERAGVGLQEDPRDNRIAMVQDQVSDNSVLVDTTTLASAEHALLQPAALSLLDLSLATFAFITSDRVVVQPSQQHSATVFVSRFGDACQILEFSREFIDGPLWSVCGELLRALDNNDSQLHGSLTSAWQHFFDRSDIRLNARTIDHNQDSPGAWDGVPATYYAGQALHDHGSSAHSAETLSSFISVQTIRALYNDNLAAVLRIPYLSTSIRSPVYAELLRQKVEAQLLADKLLAQIGPPVALTVQPGPYVAECSAPFLLGIVLSRIKRPDEYWQEVGRLREEFAPLRKRISDDRAEWTGRSGAYVGNYLKYVSGYTPESIKAAGQMLSETASLATSLATASPMGGGLVKLALKLAFAIKPAEHAYQWYLRRFRPDVRVVVELAEEARKLRSIESEIERLWGAAWTRGEHDLLERLSLARPDAFSKLRRLD